MLATAVMVGRKTAAGARTSDGRGADTPQEIPPQGWLDIAKRTRKEVKADQVPLLAAGRRLRQGADVVQRWGRGPLADRLRRPITTATGTDKPGR